MKTQFARMLFAKILSKRAAVLIHLFFVGSLIVGGLLSAVHFPARAAAGRATGARATVVEKVMAGQNGWLQEPACTPPSDWDRTSRLMSTKTSTKEWTFEIDEPEMEVVLEFFYYQDYDLLGCPFDCSAGDCTTDETGIGTTPLGTFELKDGKEGASDGSERLSGRLPKGTYQAVFQATGGSLNIGLKVHRSSVPTATPLPTHTPTPEPPTPTATASPTEQVVPSQPTVTATQNDPVTNTPTTIPTGTDAAPLATATPTPVDPLAGTPTPTAEGNTPHPTRTPKPPATLPPPSAPTAVGQPPSLIPETGADLAGAQLPAAFTSGLFLKLGVALLGVTLILRGIGKKTH